MKLRLRDAYRSLASLLRSGMVLSEALGELQASGALPAGLGADLKAAVEKGEPLHAALAAHPDLIPDEDVALVEAGEATGHLEENLERLALLREERKDSVRRMLTDVWYPILVGHAAALLIPVASLSSTGRLTFGRWAERVALVLVPAYFLVWLLVFRLERSAVWRDGRRKLVALLPGFGNAARHRGRAVFTTVLAEAYQAGVPVGRAIRLAARASRDPAGEKAVQAVEKGEKLTTGLTRARILPAATLSRLAAAEEAGDLYRTLHSIAADEIAEAQAIFRRAMVTLGQIFFLLIAAWIAWFVISFFVHMYSYSF